ncbi:teichoic acids export ABC transporter ATP-binding subunit TagH [Salinicoccus siamensis]|uniref:Teichoic acids export ABC transporter ATP-binding subunit TagH n=1 Tax=Salinicoccus siamensis TaxID=381830 RepID=A0ABV5Z5N2_9STAP
MTKTIITKNLEKHYKLYENQKERILDLVSPRSHGEVFHALRGIDFEAEDGDVVGFIGINGSGKSTLSNIIAGIVPESRGEVIVNGQTSLIAVAAGLNNDLTGRDNIELKCLMLGFSRDEIREMEPDIIAFAELESFIDQPVKSYSSGMKSRLGFAISVNVDPDILIIDEALSVGDRAFSEKSLRKMNEFKEQGKTMIFVSHSINQVKNFCNKILWLEFGRVKAFGEVNDVIPLYEAFLNKWQKMSKKERDAYRALMTEQGGNDTVYSQQGNLLVMNSDKELNASNDYKVHLTSRLAHLREHSTYIYQSPNTDENRKNADEYKDRVFYIKRKTIYQFEHYYLLSTKPSGIEGVIGWMKATELASHTHTFVDNDNKTLFLLGNGLARTEPWGGKKQTISSSLENLKNSKFHINETILVGKNIWYKGIIDDQNSTVWLHEASLSDKIEN